MNCHLPALRLLIVPGLHDSGPAHWQTWLQAVVKPSLRVTQRDWSDPHLARWASRIASTLDHAGPGPWVVVGHSFGALALAAHLADPAQQRADAPIVGALLVAPADPDKFGLGELLPRHALACTSTVVASDSDPWMPARQAVRWAGRWGSHVVNLGDAGHINAEAGFGPLPLARQWVLAMSQRAARQRHAAVSPTIDQACAAPAAAVFA